MTWTTEIASGIATIDAASSGGRRRPRSTRCATCGAPTVRIQYGFPSIDLFEAADRGDVILGGCAVFDDNPTRSCTNELCSSHNSR